MTRKVLIVDDSKLARMSVAKALKSLEPDWVRLEAANADEALQVLTLEQPDVILLDFNMPGRDGLALAAELHDHHPQMPIAIISANIQVEIVNRAKASGAEFLPKPVTEQSLSAFIDTAKKQFRD